MALVPLEESVRHRLRSGVAITSLAQCVTELVDNSIDAGATCVAVRVDMLKFKLQVVDNGKGISESGMSVIGGRYVTSKCHTVYDLDHNLQHLGYRGEALASIINVSRRVEISSRHHLSQSTFDNVFLSGQLVGINPAKGQRPSVGTTVTLHDFFYNMPVRRNTMVEVLELEQVKRAVECIALVNPSVSFSVRNDNSGALLLQTHKTNSVLSNFGLLFASSRVGKMSSVQISHDKFTVSGYISTETHHNNSLQFVYVNRRIVRKTMLHTCVNNVLSNSLLLKKQKLKDTMKESSQTKSPSRAADKYPVYVLLIECPRSEYDICLEPAKTLIEFKHRDTILSTLTLLVKNFLKQHCLYIGLGSFKSETRQSADSSKSSKPSSCNTVPDPLLPVVKSRVMTRRPGVMPQSVETEIDRDLSSHNYSVSEEKDSPHFHINSNAHTDATTVHTPPEHQSPSAQNITPTSFMLSTYRHRSTSPRFHQSSTPFIVPYNSPSPRQPASNILSRILSQNCSSPSSSPQSFRTQVYSPLHSATVSSKLARLARERASNECTDHRQTYGCSNLHIPLYQSTPNVPVDSLQQVTAHSDSEAQYRPLNHEKDQKPLSSHCESIDSGYNQTINSVELQPTPLHGQHQSATKCFNSPSNKPLWKETVDPTTGRKIYVHSTTGNCSYVAPTPVQAHFDDSGLANASGLSPASTHGAKPLRAAPHLSHDFEPFVPRPKSQRLLDTSLSSTEIPKLIEEYGVTVSPNVKWRCQSEVDRQSGKRKSSSFEILLRDWKNPTFQAGQEGVLDIGYGAGTRRQIKVHNLKSKFIFTKDMFSDLVVLNQVDNKFIACLMSKGKHSSKNLLVMVDQHAAHERVRLEALLEDLYESPASKGQVKKSVIHPPLVLTLSTSEMSMAKHFKQQLAQIGVTSAVDSDGRLLVSSLPAVFMEREVSKVSRGRPAVALNIIQEMIVKHLELLEATGGGSVTTPTAITHVLHSKACHGAIKFGDPLTLSECKVLIHSLSKCKLPFQCAHGRPAMMPILDLDALNQRFPPHKETPFPQLAALLPDHAKL